MAEEVAKRVVDLLQPKFDQLHGELRAKTHGLGEDIDVHETRTMDGDHFIDFRDNAAQRRCLAVVAQVEKRWRVVYLGEWGERGDMPPPEHYASRSITPESLPME